MHAQCDVKSILASLVGFDTTSDRSNLRLIEYIDSYLAQWDVSREVIYNQDRTKAGLVATIGRGKRGGVVLSGHTDCVPVAGQDWATNPFELVEVDGLLFGRGTSDMKGFLAAMLAIVPDLCSAEITRPVHLVFSYDEELGCTGVRTVLADMISNGYSPSFCVVGEPTSMDVVTAHKSGRSYRCSVGGLEAHSSLTPHGVNAIEAAARIIGLIGDIGSAFKRGPNDHVFDVPFSTISTGRIEGGTATNIVPNHCSFDFEYRMLPGIDPDLVVNKIRRWVERELLPEMRLVHSEATVTFTELFSYPAFEIAEEDQQIVQIKSLLKTNGARKVAYGTEAGLFQAMMNLPTVVCGPGSIGLAHKPNEYVNISDLEKCQRFLLDFVRA